MKPQHTKLERALSLVELLVVVAIIGLLLGILLPSVIRARRQAKRTVCMALAYQMDKVDEEQLLRLKLDALNCGCYGEYRTNLGEYTGCFCLPQGMDEETFRRCLEEELGKTQ